MKVLCCGLILALFFTPVRGVYESPALDELWQQAGEYGIHQGDSLETGLARLLRAVPVVAEEILSAGVRTGLKLLAVVLVCALGEGLQGAGISGPVSVTRLAGALAVTAMTMTDITAMIGLGRETMEKMDLFSAVLLPVMALLTALSGGLTAAAARQGATVLFSKALVSVMDGLLIPLVYAFVAVNCARAAWGEGSLDRLAQSIKTLVTGILTALLVVFVGYLTASGAIAGSADLSRIKAARMAISRAIPVVGSVLADASETVLAGAGALKGSVGAAGMLVVLAICLIPFLHLAGQYLVYKTTAALCGLVAQGELSRLIDAIGSAFGLVLGMTGAAALILLVSVASAVLTVTG